jgi:tRNA U34 5-carboxymethylaminomethyl modifying enzyme MnmG/GidA
LVCVFKSKVVLTPLTVVYLSEGPIQSNLSPVARYNLLAEMQDASVAAYRKEEMVLIPKDFDYRKFVAISFAITSGCRLTLTFDSRMLGISNECIERLEAAKPSTLGALSRLEGVTPTAALEVFAALKKQRLFSRRQHQGEEHD